VRSIENFRLSGRSMGSEPQLLRALGEVKAAAARANAQLGVIATDVADAIVHAAREVARARWSEHFPLDVVQGGGGTASNMNVNEVIANRAGELLGEPDAEARELLAAAIAVDGHRAPPRFKRLRRGNAA
jgi:aspartate ammonia-lyase